MGYATWLEWRRILIALRLAGHDVLSMSTRMPCSHRRRFTKAGVLRRLAERPAADCGVVDERPDRPAASRPAAVIGAGSSAARDAVRRAGTARSGHAGTPSGPTARARPWRGHDHDRLAELSDPSIDVVHARMLNATHAPLATAAPGRQAHVVEPLALDAAAARGLVDLAGRVDRHAMVAFTYRGYPMVGRARGLVEAGELGGLRLIHGTYLQDWLSGDSDYNWRIDPVAGGASRAVADIGSHWFDTAGFISGLRVEAVCADLATFVPFRDRPTAAVGTFEAGSGLTERVAVRSEDAAAILVRFAGGVLGSCVVSQVSPGHKTDFAIEFAGSEACLAWRQEAPESLWLGTREGGSRRP
jgi:predicted dehydrogenase